MGKRRKETLTLGFRSISSVTTSACVSAVVTATNLPAVAGDCIAMIMLTTQLLLASLLLFPSCCDLFAGDDVPATAVVSTFLVILCCCPHSNANPCSCLSNGVSGA